MIPHHLTALAVEDVADAAGRLSANKWDTGVSSKTLRQWADRLAVAQRQLEDLARFQEAQGE